LLFKQIGSLITSLGLIGFGATFALQKPILNFVGWINIVFSKNYKIGDIISINNVNGKVHDIKLMYTNLSELNSEGDRTGRSVSIPNEFVLTTPVINYTKGTSFIWDILHIYLTYQSNLKKSLKIIEEVCQDFYDKKIKSDIKKIFKDSFKDYEKIIVRVIPYEKGIRIKIIYLVDFNVSNVLRSEMTKELLNKLKGKDIILGKIEDMKSGFKTF
jgi:small-conductance mechanosensitive channel